MLWWTVSALRPVRKWQALLVVCCGTVLRTALVTAVLVGSAGRSLHMLLLSVAGFVLARPILTGLIGQRLAKPQQVLPS
jgi:hypothetical protein